MNDVARRAGVSQTAVSLVLNDPENSGIPPATQERIHEAVREVGYRTNRLARAMRLDRTDTIGFVTDNIATTPYANGMIQGAQDAAWESGHLLLVVNAGAVDDPDHAELERAAVDQLLERQVDGIVLAAMFHRVLEPPPALAERRAVLLDARAPDGRFPSVVPDETEAAYTATTHLIEHGHRRIAHIANDYPAPAGTLRRAGYQAALADHGIEPDPDLIVSTASTQSGGRVAAAELFDRSSVPTAVFCFNDAVAMGVYQEAARRGIDIPSKLSVIGFDDHALIAAELMPALTTMRLPHYEMGHWAVRTLLDDADSDGAEQHTLPCPLIERHSVQAI